MLILFLAALLLAPASAFVAGFLAGQVRGPLLRMVVAAAIILFPLGFFLTALLDPWASADQKYEAAFGLEVLGFHIGLWTLFGTMGAFVGAAKARGPR